MSLGVSLREHACRELQGIWSAREDRVGRFGVASVSATDSHDLSSASHVGKNDASITATLVKVSQNPAGVGLLLTGRPGFGISILVDADWVPLWIKDRAE